MFSATSSGFSVPTECTCNPHGRWKRNATSYCYKLFLLEYKISEDGLVSNGQLRAINFTKDLLIYWHGLIKLPAFLDLPHCGRGGAWLWGRPL